MATPITLPDPYSIEGAKRISQLTGQALAPSTPINVSAFTTPTPVHVPDLPVPKPSPSSIVLPPIQNTPEQDVLKTEKDNLIGTINADTTKLGTKSTRKTEIETAQGIPQLNKDIQELYDQANAIDAASVQMNANSEDRLAPSFAIVGEQAQIERQAAAKKAGIAAIATAKQGKLALAQDYVTKAIAAEFDPVEKEIENKKFLLTVNMDNFNTDEKRRAERRLEELNTQKDTLTQSRADKKSVFDIMVKAIEGGADNATATRIQDAKTPDEAVTVAGHFLRDPDAELKTQLVKEQILAQRQNRANQETNNLIDRAKLGDTKALATLGITPTTGGKLRVDQKESAALNKEIAGNDTYKAIDKAMASWRALKEYEKVATTPQNPIFDPIDAKKANNTYNTALLQLKEYYNLGVLNGPDLSIMQTMLPSSVKGFGSTAVSTVVPFVGGAATSYIIKNQVKNGIENQKVQFQDKLDSDYLTLRSQYSNYDPSQVTLLTDIDRKYLQMKAEINPEIATFLKENPDLPLGDKIQVINSRL